MPRALLRLALLALALLIALPLHALWRLARRPSPWPRRFLAAVARIVGARLRVVGTPCRANVAILANHLSWLDIPLLAGVTGTRFVAKAELAGVPLVGWLCRLGRTVFVARGDRAGVAAQVAAVRAALADAAPLAMFPEGTTGDGAALLPFKPALLAALVPPPAGVAVQPVAIGYGEATRELAWHGGEPALAHARRVLARPGTFTATLRFAEPFDPAAFPDRKALAVEARRRVAAAGGWDVAAV